jgi:hypothetical protein
VDLNMEHTGVAAADVSEELEEGSYFYKREHSHSPELWYIDISGTMIQVKKKLHSGSWVMFLYKRVDGIPIFHDTYETNEDIPITDIGQFVLDDLTQETHW